MGNVYEENHTSLEICSGPPDGAVCLLGAGLVLPAAADSPYKLPDDLTVASPAALVVYLGLTPEQDTVLFEKNADEVRAPAALVRLMVGAYALKLIEENNIDVATATGHL